MPSGARTKSKTPTTQPPKKSGPQPLTPEQVKELISDRNRRLATLYNLTNKKGQITKFRMNKVQQHLDKHHTNRNIILKSRQHGVTTYEAIDMLDEMLFHPGWQGLIISYDKESMEEIFDNKIMYTWNSFPLRPWYEINTERSNKLKVGFKDNPDQITSKSFSSLMVRQSGRGGTFNRIHISEFGTIAANSPSKAKKIITGAFPTVPIATGRIDIESTAEGDEGEFHDMFWKAWNRQLQGIEKKLTEFQAFFFNWQWDELEINSIQTPEPNLPLEFKKYQADHNAKCLLNPMLQPITDIQITYWYYKYLELGEDWKKLFQEYPTTPEEAFVSSKTKFFDFMKLQSLERHAQKPYQVINRWNYFRPYIAGHRYVIGVDVAEGIGKDSSAIVVLDVSTPLPMLVATFEDDEIAPDTLAYEIRSIALQYGMPIVGIERNNHGLTTITTLLKLYPENLIYKMHSGEDTDEGLEETSKYGWHSNKATKPKMLYDLRTVTNLEAIIIPSLAVLSELKTYSKSDVSKTTRKDDGTKHWDLVMALGIAFQMRTALEEYSSGPIRVTNQNAQTSNNIHNGV